MSDDLRRRWLWMADSEFAGYSPTYDAIARAVADDDALLQVLAGELSREEQQPLLLLAAVHYLLLGGVEHALAEIYRGTSSADRGTAFLEFFRERRDDVLGVIHGHRTQTNEAGRSAVLAPALRVVAERFGEPLALVEVGASGGINLRMPWFRLDYGVVGATGPADSPVVVHCEIRGGHPPIADSVPQLDPVLGLDQAPIDLYDEDTARWLLACVWPGTGRFQRTRAAIDVARQHPVEIRQGDAIDNLPQALADVPAARPVVIVTTWVLAYLPREKRLEFADAVAAVGAERPVAWISAEGPGVVAALSAVADVPKGASVLGLVTHRSGAMTSEVLATMHPHGAWLDWRAN